MRTLLLIWFCLASLSIKSQTGIAWSAPMDIAMSSHDNMHPRIVTDGTGNPLIIWGKMPGNECKFSRWDGSMFTTPVVLNPGTIPVFTQSWAGPDIASRGDTVYVVFKETPEDVNNIYITRSFDGGVNFSAPVQVDFIAADVSRFPTVTVDETGNPVVAFMKFNSSFGNARWVVTRSSDYGMTFTPDVLASGWSGGAVCDCCPGSIVNSGSSVALLYRDNLSNIRDSWCGFSTDTGNTFSSGINVDLNNWMINACPSTGPDGIIVGDSLYSVFMSSGSGSSRVYSNSNSISTQQTQASQLLSGMDANYPRISNYDKSAAVVWKQYNGGNAELALRFAVDIDSGFSALYDTVSLSGVENCDVAVYDGNVYVVWEDYNSGTVKYRKGTYSSLNTSISDVKKNASLIVYPNPVDGNLLSVSANNNILSYSIKDNTGKLVLSGKSVAGFGRELKIEISTLSKGMYLIEINKSESKQATKFFRN